MATPAQRAFGVPSDGARNARDAGGVYADGFTRPPEWVPSVTVTRHTICAVKGCHRSPHRYSYFCNMHMHRKTRTGSEHGRLLRRHELKSYREAIEPTLDRYAEHRSVVAALEYLQTLIDGTGQTSREEWEWLRRLRDRDVPAREALLILLAVWGGTVYLRLEDGVALDANLGNALLHLVPEPIAGRKPSGQARRHRPLPSMFRPLGRRIREALGPLLARLWEIYEAEHQHQARLLHELSGRVVATIGEQD